MKQLILIQKYLFQSTKGHLDLVNNLNEEWERMRTGEQYFILYSLNFPVKSPLPTIKSITVNNQVICRGNKPSKCTEFVHIHYSTIYVAHTWRQHSKWGGPAWNTLMRPWLKKFHEKHLRCYNSIILTILKPLAQLCNCPIS